MSDLPGLPLGNAEVAAPCAGFNGYVDDYDALTGVLTGEVPLSSGQGSGAECKKSRTTTRKLERAEEARERNKVLQRNYRERRKWREEEVHAALESARSELESLRVEHGHLTQEFRVFSQGSRVY
jgi:hypothetical protein